MVTKHIPPTQLLLTVFNQFMWSFCHTSPSEWAVTLEPIRYYNKHKNINLWFAGARLSELLLQKINQHLHQHCVRQTDRQLSLTSSRPSSLAFRSRMVESLLYFFSVSSLLEVSSSESRVWSCCVLRWWLVSSSRLSCSFCCCSLVWICTHTNTPRSSSPLLQALLKRHVLIRTLLLQWFDSTTVCGLCTWIFRELCGRHYVKMYMFGNLQVFGIHQHTHTNSIYKTFENPEKMFCFVCLTQLFTQKKVLSEEQFEDQVLFPFSCCSIHKDEQRNACTKSLQQFSAHFHHFLVCF